MLWQHRREPSLARGQHGDAEKHGKHCNDPQGGPDSLLLASLRRGHRGRQQPATCCSEPAAGVRAWGEESRGLSPNKKQTKNPSR